MAETNENNQPRKSPIKWDVIFSGVQALSAVIVTLIALWAAFFTTLPEALEKQLRSEVAKVNDELIAARHNKSELEQQRADLMRANTDLSNEQRKLISQVDNLGGQIEVSTKENAELNRQTATLQSSIQELTDQKRNLISELAKLAAERSSYAIATSRSVNGKLVAMIRYEIELNDALTNICVKYDLHQGWLSANQELPTAKRQWEVEPFPQKFESNNAAYKRYMKLSEKAQSPPETWIYVPSFPSLEPNDSQSKVAIDEFHAKLLNSMNPEKDVKNLNKFLMGWLFDRTIPSRGARGYTGEKFIEEVKSYGFLSDLLDAERQALIATLDGFLQKYPEQKNALLRPVFDKTPTAAEIRNQGSAARKSLDEFKGKFFAYLRENGLDASQKSVTTGN